MTAQPATSGGQPRPQRRRGRSNAVAADYDWILGDSLFQAYCLTLVEDCEDTGATKTAAFALAERLTGVLVSDTVLYDDAEFLCGTVRIPD
ncbi:DUF6461 domain-containing protein [Nocardia altamirensis]|uniref:DUF6461 domain-containing protein n=1 Tax=Nocardia altamirensis TaxID=472158 RepID=UPI0008403B41|nr:DUF6461 domain-containing protein [Nocardia altamirensis]